MEKLKLTESAVRALGPAPKGRRFVWDSLLPGLALVVHPSGVRTFVVQRRNQRLTVGHSPPMHVEEARARARELLVELDRGGDARARATTLEAALGWHLASMRAKECSPRSLETLEEEVQGYLADWLGRPLREIGKDECVRRHERITEMNGPYAANRAMRHLRAVWNTADRRLDDLPKNPVRAITFNKERRRREPIPWDELPAWRKRVDAISNPIRRDYHLFVLLTGLRREDAATVRWEHVDFAAGTVHRPRPKGGVDRAFTVPLSAPALEVLRHRREENEADAGYAFPTISNSGKVVPIVSPAEDGLPNPHRLRDTFATAAYEARVDPMAMKILLNHTIPGGDVTLGYVRPSLEWLRGEVEKVGAFLAARLRTGLVRVGSTG